MDYSPNLQSISPENSLLIYTMRMTEPEKTVVIGGGPAGLIAAEELLNAGRRVALYDASPSIGRKFLRAGKGGLNLTHSEPFEQFITRYGSSKERLRPFLEQFGPNELRRWAKDLGFQSFVGSSGRVFPEGMKAAPLLRAWRERLLAAGLELHLRHRWVGWGEEKRLKFETEQGEKLVSYSTLVFALGGASWPQLGSTGAWIPTLEERGVPVSPFRPANCGFDVAWSEHLISRFNGKPVKSTVIHFTNSTGEVFQQPGEVLITETGIEGGPVYALSAPFRDEIERGGHAVIHLDLFPDLSTEQLTARLSKPQGSRSLSSHLKRTVGLEGVKAGLLWEFFERDQIQRPEDLAAALKRVPIPLISPRPLSEAISSAGGVVWDALDTSLMLKDLPGVFCAGEMIDWEAPTGGYLLTACFSTGRAAGQAAAAWSVK